MEINQRNSDKNLNKKKSFKIRRRKTFLIEKGDNSVFKRNSLNKNISKKRRVSSKKRGFLFNLSLTNFNNAEEEIKNALIEMRKSCLWELRRQSYDIKSLETNNKRDERKLRTFNNHKCSSKYLYNNSINDNSFELEKKRKQKISHSHIIKNNEYIKEYYLNDNGKNNILDTKKNDKEKNCDYHKKDVKTLSNFESSVNSKKLNKKKTIKDKFRFLSRGCLVIDSFDENESDEEQEPSSYLINPETNTFFIYDLLIVLAVLFSLFCFPYELAKYFCLCNLYNNIILIIIEIFIDFLFIVDLIINFFLEYYTKEEEILVKIKFKIIYNYMSGWFFFDFLAAVPFNFISLYYCKKNPITICHTYQNDNVDLLLLLRCLKAIKIFKILNRKKNQFLTKLCEKCSQNIILENIVSIIRNIIFVLFALHIISCIYICIGKHTFPGWIYSNGFQNKSFIKLYMVSIYYITTTLTTVGYGDIDFNSIIEIYFRIILLAVGIIGYSWIISSISNGINKESYASINFDNECQILEEIRITHRKLPYSLYLNIINHLKSKHFYQKKYDKNLLINSLPYTLKNNLIFSMYKTQIMKFDYFKNPSNSNFLVDVLTCFSPISAVKEDILLKENDLIEEMFFVREGKLALEVPIDIDNPEESINKYLSNDFLNFAFDFNPNQSYTLIPRNSTNSFIGGNLSFIFTNHTNIINTGNKKEDKKKADSIYLRVHDIHKNEDYGDIFMAYRRRSPFALRVKSRRVKLFVIKKNDFYKLYEQYKNVFRSIYKKKKHNYIIIKNILIKTIAKFCSIKGIKIDDKYKDTIKRATNELNKEIIPIEILKKPSLMNEINEIDEEINRTIKEFDHEFSSIKGSLTKKKIKFFENIKKVNTSTILQKKKYILDDLNNLSDYESRYYSSFLKGRKKRNLKKKIKKIKTKIKSNVALKENFKDINFNFSESDDSIETVKVKENENRSSSSPTTIKTLPKSLVNSIKARIQNRDLNEKSENILEENNIFICINNNCNCGNNFININNSNIINNMHNAKKMNRNYSSSNVTFDNMFNCKNKEENNSIKSKEVSFKYKKSNLTSVSLYNMKKFNNVSFSNGLNNHKKEVKSTLKNTNFDTENLFSTSVESFEIKSSYRNLNQATEGKYIKDEKLQEKTIKYIKEYNHKNTKKNTKVEKHKRYNLEDHQIINKIKYKNDKNNNNMSKNYIKIKSKSRKNNKNILNITPKEKNSFSSKNIRSKITNKDLSINSYFDNTAKELNKEDDQNISKYKEKYNDYIIDKYSKIRDSTKEDFYIDNNKKINK